MGIQKKDISSAEIARLAGVSRSTVSRVINNNSSISVNTRERVISIIKEYNYYPNISAQVLAGKKKKTIGLFAINHGSIADDYIASLLMGSVFDSASSHGYHVYTGIIRDTRDAESIRSIREAFLQRRIDGGIFWGHANHETLIEELIAERFIIGLFDQKLPGREEPNRIVFNLESKEAASMAVKYLRGLNHKDIGIINGDIRKYSGAEKNTGFINGLKEEKLKIVDSWITMGSFSKDGGYQCMKDILMNNKTLPTGICCANDAIAFGAIKAINEAGLKVPDDISIIGMDDHIFSPFFKPAITTFRFDFRKLMKDLTVKVIQVIEDNEVKGFINQQYGFQLIERESCRKL